MRWHKKLCRTWTFTPSITCILERQSSGMQSRPCTAKSSRVLCKVTILQKKKPKMHARCRTWYSQSCLDVFYQQYKECHEFLRHKTFIVSPKVLTDHSVPVHRCVQHEGEFIITFPFGYHAGYNLGFNCAESVNFALDSWLEIGKRAKACNCISDSVVIDISIFDQNKPTSVHAESEATQQHQQEAAAAAATSTSKSKSRKRNRHDFEKTGAKDKVHNVNTPQSSLTNWCGIF